MYANKSLYSTLEKKLLESNFKKNADIYIYYVNDPNLFVKTALFIQTKEHDAL